MVRLHLDLSSDPEFNDWLTEFQGESDRAAGVLGPAYLDFLLGEMLVASWADETVKFKGNNFGLRIKLVHAMGLIADDEAEDLDVIRQVRNVFAHEIHGSFNADDRVISKCKDFLLARERMNAEEALRETYGDAPLRKFFDFEIALLAYYLTRRLAKVRRLPAANPALWPDYDRGHEKR